MLVVFRFYSLGFTLLDLGGFIELLDYDKCEQKCPIRAIIVKIARWGLKFKLKLKKSHIINIYYSQ